LKNIDAIIADLEQRRAAIARALEALRQVGGPPAAKRRGRPPGSQNQSARKKPGGTKRQLSPEGKHRIIAATKRRWAAARAAKKSA
jgi:hypothetical protein